MRSALWIARDLLREIGAGKSRVFILLFLLLWLPFQMGFIDGAASGQPAWRDHGFRISLVMSGSWPAVAVAGLVVDVMFTRRVRRQHEPLLAAPVTDFWFVAGHALPGVAAGLVLSPATFVAQTLGFRMVGGALPAAPGWEFLDHLLITLTAAVWVTAGFIDAALHARDVTTLTLRSSLGLAAVLPLDLVQGGLRLLSLETPARIVCLIALAGGPALFGLVTARLDRQALVLAVEARRTTALS